MLKWFLIYLLKSWTQVIDDSEKRLFVVYLFKIMDLVIEDSK